MLRQKKQRGQATARKYVATAGFLRRGSEAPSPHRAPPPDTTPSPAPAAAHATSTPVKDASHVSRGDKSTPITLAAAGAKGGLGASGGGSGSAAKSAAKRPASTEKAAAARSVKRAFDFSEDSQTEYVAMPTAQKKRSGKTCTRLGTLHTHQPEGKVFRLLQGTSMLLAMAGTLCGHELLVWWWDRRVDREAEGGCSGAAAGRPALWGRHRHCGRRLAVGLGGIPQQVCTSSGRTGFAG